MGLFILERKIQAKIQIITTVHVKSNKKLQPSQLTMLVILSITNQEDKNYVINVYMYIQVYPDKERS